jgi:hypothetical protein
MHPHVSEAQARMRNQELHREAALYRLARPNSPRRAKGWIRARIDEVTAFLSHTAQRHAKNAETSGVHVATL